jgi:hypothetical protein
VPRTWHRPFACAGSGRGVQRGVVGDGAARDDREARAVDAGGALDTRGGAEGGCDVGDFGEAGVDRDVGYAAAGIGSADASVGIGSIRSLAGSIATTGA